MRAEKDCQATPSGKNDEILGRAQVGDYQTIFPMTNMKDSSAAGRHATAAMIAKF